MSTSKKKKKKEVKFERKKISNLGFAFCSSESRFWLHFEIPNKALFLDLGVVEEREHGRL